MSRRSGVLSNENAQSLLREVHKTQDAKAKGDLLEVMSTVQGRRFIWALLADAGAFAPSFSGEALSTAFNEGRRSVALGLLGRIRAEATDLYVLAFNEQLDTLRSETKTREAAEAAAEAPEEG